MSIISAVAGVAGNALSGGLLGIVGSIGGKVVDGIVSNGQAKAQAELAKITQPHEIAMAQLSQQASAAQAEAAQATQELADQVETVKATIDDQAQLGTRTSQWATDALAFFRPCLTTFLIFATMVEGFQWFHATQVGGIDPFKQFATMSSMAVAWWFSSRDQFKRDTMS